MVFSSLIDIPWKWKRGRGRRGGNLGIEIWRIFYVEIFAIAAWWKPDLWSTIAMQISVSFASTRKTARHAALVILVDHRRQALAKRLIHTSMWNISVKHWYIGLGVKMRLARVWLSWFTTSAAPRSSQTSSFTRNTGKCRVRVGKKKERRGYCGIRTRVGVGSQYALPGHRWVLLTAHAWKHS